jgi:hypothetical protein
MHSRCACLNEFLEETHRRRVTAQMPDQDIAIDEVGHG